MAGRERCGSVSKVVEDGIGLLGVGLLPCLMYTESTWPVEPCERWVVGGVMTRLEEEEGQRVGP